MPIAFAELFFFCAAGQSGAAHGVQINGDTILLKGGPREKTKPIICRRFFAPRQIWKDLIKQSGREHGLCGFTEAVIKLRLAPSDHLRIEPCRLRRIRPRSTPCAKNKIPAVRFQRAFGTDLKNAAERTLDEFALGADTIRRREFSRKMLPSLPARRQMRLRQKSRASA